MARRATADLGTRDLGEISIRSLPRKPRRPLLHKARHTFLEIAALQRDLHLAVGIDGRFGKGLERHVIKLPLDHRDRTRRDEIGKVARIGIGLPAQLIGRLERGPRNGSEIFYWRFRS